MRWLSIPNYTCFLCQAAPTEAAISLNKMIFEPTEKILVNIDFGDFYRYIDTITANLFV